MLVTSPSGNNGKTTVVSGLARSLAGMGRTVVAADCDFRNPSLSRSQPHTASAGLKAVSVGRAPVGQALVAAEPSTLRIAVAEEDGGTTRLGLEGARRLVAVLSGEAEIVVIDTAPITSAFETSLLAAAEIDAVILVVDLRTVRQDALKAALDQLAVSGVTLTGIVINRAPASAAFDYGYGGRDAGARKRAVRQPLTMTPSLRAPVLVAVALLVTALLSVATTVAVYLTDPVVVVVAVIALIGGAIAFAHPRGRSMRRSAPSPSNS